MYQRFKNKRFNSKKQKGTVRKQLLQKGRKFVEPKRFIRAENEERKKKVKAEEKNINN